ncbi:hypothetical protein EAI_12466 [Harpegnathos saltator]|uniref:Chitin-binding type-2 domain-containing protein n=1 Tax=Harpegnathos saltator TaxID=610380 RepID=E2BXV1_HARSA|nr:hypothetical protein EAI_12466 [Harpegnathos saltator]
MLRLVVLLLLFFFGNEDLLKEWLKGAGVTGQPGVDYPALTSIPATSFSCRGLRGGYYADLETNCQVFHICDNGRKISFLCPNGTIFQQSQLICDWWFKVDCSKSTELYEQSAEQLAEEERKRADARKMKSEFHRTVEQDNANYYDTQNADYDGRQNGRTNPYGQSVKQNQVPERQEEPKSVQHFGPNNVFDQSRDSGRYFQENNGNALRGRDKTTQPAESYNQPTATTTTMTRTTTKQRQQYESGSNYQAGNRQRNQLLDSQSGKFSYEHSNKLQDTRQNYQNTFGNPQDYRLSPGATRNEKPEYQRGSKSRTLTRNNLFGSQNSLRNSENQSQKVTPTYMETTTFRTTTAPPREFQQFAESAAFVSNRGNRFNSKQSENNRQFYYQSYHEQRGSTVDDRETTTVRYEERSEEANNNRISFAPKTGALPYPGPTFAPIYKPRTTTIPPYETTLQYTPTTETPFSSTSYYRQEDFPETTYTTYSAEPVTATASTFEDYQTTEASATTYNEQQQQTPALIGRVPPAANYPNQYAPDNARVTERDIERETTASFATTRPYLNTESYRYNTVNASSVVSQDAYPSSTPYFDDASRSDDYRSENDVEAKGTTRDPSRGSSPSFRQNSISSTEKPWRSTNVYQQSGSTSKTLSPYDTSFTYKQGKVLSTLGPYVPFTKNYVYSTMTTTSRPPITASTYHSPTIADYRITTSNLIPKVKSSTLQSATSRPKDRATYLPEVGNDSGRPPAVSSLEDRPYAEREHALSMLHSLQGLENKANGLHVTERTAGSGRSIPLAPGPSTLHSLALYFATASDSFDSNETAEPAASAEDHPEAGESLSAARSSSSVELPTSILTQHTITSYADLFNLNNALEGNATATAELTAEADDVSELDDEQDLELEQSEGPLNGAKKTNGTKFRELAQVFTHALSAYLQDPDTFKKALTDIRPTEPPSTTTDGQFDSDSTTLYPTTAEEYSSVTKEKDEVLDFSDDSDSARRRRPTTVQPPTTTDRYSTYYTTPYDDDYYSTQSQTTRRPVYYPSTTLLPPGESGEYVETTTQVTSGNTFAYEVNRAFGTTAVNDIRGYDAADTRDSTDLSPIYDNYFPSSEDEDNARGRIAGFHNNTARNFQPYGKNVKPANATPINNYVTSTLASFQSPAGTSWGRGSASDKPVQNLTPPHYQRFGNVKSFEVSNSIVPSQARSTTPLPRSKPTYEASSSTVHPFRIPTVSDADVTPYTATVVRATSSKPANAFSSKQPSSLSNDHWTSSPMVTQLWETTVFVDPRHINHGLESDDVTQSSTTDNSVNELTSTASTSRPSTLSSEAADRTPVSRATTTSSTSSPWQWAPNDNDSPVAFTLLPTTFAAENTATPSPIISTRSSITTTITSSVTSTNVGRDSLPSTLLPFTLTTGVWNNTENEVVKAQEMFGKLNETSSDTLMRVMKQADNNETVRQLVLLLINHCNGPRNKTMEQEKEQLLDALLRMPVNEFSSEESREIVAGISRLSLPIGKSRAAASISSTPKIPRATSVGPTSSEPSITTFRSRAGRRFRTTTESTVGFARRFDEDVSADTNNSLSEDETAASDNRALELLRSLYSIAAKWG